MYSAVAVVLIIVFIINILSGVKFITSGRLTDSFIPHLLTIFFCAVSIAVWIKIIRDKSKSKRDDSNGD